MWTRFWKYMTKQVSFIFLCVCKDTSIVRFCRSWCLLWKRRHESRRDLMADLRQEKRVMLLPIKWKRSFDRVSFVMRVIIIFTCFFLSSFCTAETSSSSCGCFSISDSCLRVLLLQNSVFLSKSLSLLSWDFFSSASHFVVFLKYKSLFLPFYGQLLSISLKLFAFLSLTASITLGLLYLRCLFMVSWSQLNDNFWFDYESTYPHLHLSEYVWSWKIEHEVRPVDVFVKFRWMYFARNRSFEDAFEVRLELKSNKSFYVTFESHVWTPKIASNSLLILVSCFNKTNNNFVLNSVPQTVPFPEEHVLSSF